MSRKRLQQLTESLGRSARHYHDMFRDTLHSAFGLTDDMMMDRVFRIFDTACDNCISVVEWVEGLSVFLRGTLDERIKFCFEVYDLNGDGYISREEMFQMLKNSLLKQPAEEDPDEGIKDLVDIALKKMASTYSFGILSHGISYTLDINESPTESQKYNPDLMSPSPDHDEDGKLSFADFEKAVRDENLLLEAFGPCLPDLKSSMAFEQKTFHKIHELSFHVEH
ncbi:Efcab1 [Columba guinea]|nr:Efcab1 [Columba guinea]